jgi:hypothetical protein
VPESGLGQRGIPGLTPQRTYFAFLAMVAEQKWLDLLPGLYPNVYYLRDGSYNLAHFNLQSRDVDLIDGQVVVDGQPLKFFHFSGFEPEFPSRLSKYTPHLKDNEPSTLQELLKDYVQRLNRYGYAYSRDWPYAFDKFSDGTPITAHVREQYQHNELLRDRLGSAPFSRSAAFIEELCQTSETSSSAVPSRFTRVLKRCSQIISEFMVSIRGIT